MALATSSDNAATWQKVWRFVELYGPGTCAAGTAEEDVCAEQQWGNLSAQFGVTGPSGRTVVATFAPPRSVLRMDRSLFLDQLNRMTVRVTHDESAADAKRDHAKPALPDGPCRLGEVGN